MRYSVEQLIALARASSPVYSELYRDLPPGTPDWHQVPVLTHERLMEVVHDAQAISFFDPRGRPDGIIYQSSATTGKPKATIFGREEWMATTQLLATRHWRSGALQEGDVVANLCVGGSASFMFVHGTLEHFPGRCAEVPIGSDHPFPHILDTYRKFGANVLAGINSVFLGLAQHLLAKGESDTAITRILCGGELMYGAQLGVVQRAFPNATVIPFMFATTETGLIGLSEAGFAQNEFRVCSDASLLEIVDPTTLRPIEETGRMGLCVVTSLLRTAAPAIRMDIGDRAMWAEDPRVAERKFSIHGRRFTTRYELGPRVLITETDVAALIAALSVEVPLLKLRLDLDRDAATVVIALESDGHTGDDLTGCVTRELSAIAPGFSPEDYPVRVQLVPFSYFESGIRRKGRLIQDNREAV